MKMVLYFYFFFQDRDALSGQAHQLQREKRLLEEEMTSILMKMEEEKNMFYATAKAKELAVQEIKNYIVKNDEVRLGFLKLVFSSYYNYKSRPQLLI